MIECMADKVLLWPIELFLSEFMADKLPLALLKRIFSDNSPLSFSEIQEQLPSKVAERTLRRWIANAVEQGRLTRTGKNRSTRYSLASKVPAQPKFLQTTPVHKQELVLKQLRDLWTHTSTAIEGNTLTLGDTHFILEEGLTVSGKPIKEHQEILGHASAIDLIYQAIDKPVNEQLCFDLHKAIQTEVVHDIYKPYGKWKVQPNGTYTIGKDDKPIYLEYAKPQFVPHLMKQVIDEINSTQTITPESAHKVYAKIHVAIAHIHPFWDGNGRIARLLANVSLLRNGLLPIIIPKEKRREYIQLLAEYELKAGELTKQTGPWPKLSLLTPFESFCAECYQQTKATLAID
jgi:hypothetical protein